MIAAYDLEARYRAFGEADPTVGQRPLVGITGNYGERGCELAPGYYQSVWQAGATPVVLPPLETLDDLPALLDRLDGIVLSGGGDINPLYLGEEPQWTLGSVCPERDAQELLLVRLATDRQIPILAICRGIQVLAAAMGGTVVQDLGSEKAYVGRLIKHSQDMERTRASHTVEIADGTLLGRIFGGVRQLAVNSFHHQAVGDAGAALRVSARSVDGVIEAVESQEMAAVVGVQWHPETFILRGDRTMMPLFEWLANEARQYAEAKDVHRRVLSLDTHCDTPLLFDDGVVFAHRDPRACVDLHKMWEGRLDAVIMAAYLPQGPLTPEGYAAARKLCDARLDGIDRNMGQAPSVTITDNPDSLATIKANGGKAILKAIENGYAIGRDLDLVAHYRRRGVVYMTLCHNGDNDICDSASLTSNTHGGLSPFGREVVAEMNRVGMLVDLSHAGENTFWQTLELSKAAPVCSHSSCRALADHPRNLTDEQLRALAAKGGVCQVTFYPGFLRQPDAEAATIDDAVRHVMHAIEVAGITHVGIGTDFDGDGGVVGLRNTAQLTNLTRRLMAEGLDCEQLRLIWGENFLRAMREAQAAGE